MSQLSNAGGRLIIASDGIWDAVSSEIAAQACRGLPAELAAKLVVKVSMQLLDCPKHYMVWLIVLTLHHLIEIKFCLYSKL